MGTRKNGETRRGRKGKKRKGKWTRQREGRGEKRRVWGERTGGRKRKRRKAEWNGRGCEGRKGQEKVLGKERKQYDTIRDAILTCARKPT